MMKWQFWTFDHIGQHPLLRFNWSNGWYLYITALMQLWLMRMMSQQQLSLTGMDGSHKWQLMTKNAKMLRNGVTLEQLKIWRRKSGALYWHVLDLDSRVCDKARKRKNFIKCICLGLSVGPLSRAVLFCTLPPDSKSWPSSSCTSSHICVWATYGNPLVCHFYIALAALCIPFNGWLLLKIRNWQIFWSILDHIVVLIMRTSW